MSQFDTLTCTFSFDVAPDVPFGGHKESGIGMEWGIEGLKHYCNSRSLWVWKKVFE